jgi:drug/metabolite transporter (DMT)-like permease
VLDHEIPQPVRRRLGGEVLLVALTVLWGSSFLVIQHVEKSVSAGSVNFLRFALAAVLLSPFLRSGTRLWLIGMQMGAFLWAGFLAQAIGLRYTTSGRSAFVSCLSVIFVPMIAALTGRKIGMIVWIAAAIALGGAGLLCYDGTPANKGDLWTLLCALFFAVFIVQLESAAKIFPALALTAVQMVTVCALATPWFVMDLFRGLHFARLPWTGIVYLGVMCTAVTTWLQTVGQRHVPAAQASIIYLLEPVFATIFAFFIMHDRMGRRGMVGCALIIVATILGQAPLFRRAPGSVSGFGN